MSRKLFLKGNYYFNEKTSPKRKIICTKTSCSLTSDYFEGTDIETGEHLTDLSCSYFNELENPSFYTKKQIEEIREQTTLSNVLYIRANDYQRFYIELLEDRIVKKR